MFYNTWHVRITKESIDISLDTTDKYDRVSKRSYKPVIIGTTGFIHFPRVDDQTNEKYRKKLLKEWIKGLKGAVADLEYQMSILQKELDKPYL